MNRDMLKEETLFLKDLSQRLQAYQPERSQLIPILQMVQKEIAYLPAAAWCGCPTPRRNTPCG